MPELIQESLKSGVVGKAFKTGDCQATYINPREFTEDRHQSVDDRPFGGGDGMLMMAPPLQKALESRPEDLQGPVIYLSPQGRPFTDAWARELSQAPDLTLICGRYGGVDERFLVKNQIQELSIGDYVLSGGELAAAVVVDAVTRLRPGVLGHVDSAEVDSFSEAPWLEAPHLTRPRNWQGLEVPPILLSGDHGRVQEWKRHMSRVATVLKRPDLVGIEQAQALREALSYVGQLPQEDLTCFEQSREEILKTLRETLDAASESGADTPPGPR